VKLAGRYALITGASRGLGVEIAQHFLREGASVMLCARTVDALAEQSRILAAVAAPGARVLFARCDVSKPDEVDGLFEEVLAEFPRLDILVNNAGVYGPMGNIDEVDWHEWTEAIRINLFGTVYPCRAAVGIFGKQQYGKIINVSGGGATNPFPGITAYAAAKAAVVRFTESLALECRDRRIDVNAIAPGALATRMTHQLLAAGPAKVGRALFERVSRIAREGGTSLDLAASLCVFLAASASDGISGRLISAQWDRWEDWPSHLSELNGSDLYTLRRITGRDRGALWGDR
jgi:3-oxoacyl-[acyl-carrier protein] reductase